LILGQASTSIPSVNDLVQRWTEAAGDTQKYGTTRDLLEFLNRELYCDYQPCSDGPDFLDRLASWLHNLHDNPDGQQLLFECVPWLLFIGHREMTSMYRAAYNGPITRWIIDQANLDILDPDLSTKFSCELGHTWFGSLAGMDIGSFMRTNRIDDQSLRPDFRVLSHFEANDPKKVVNYLRKENRPYSRIVAVEDYVGTGKQMEKPCELLRKLSDFPTLICPIVAAEEGVKKGQSIASETRHISFKEFFRIPLAATISEDARHQEPWFMEALRQLIHDTWDRLRTQDRGDTPFGFLGSGALVLTYMNCPNNVPPLLHRKTLTWDPLFPRVSREG
jgi:hypothetical protein